MFDKRVYDNEYNKANYSWVHIKYRKDDKIAKNTIENLKQYAKDHNMSIQKTIMFALEKFLSDNGYI